MTDLFIFTGELSGDRLASSIVKKLHQKDPSLSIMSVAGPLLREEKVDVLMPMENFTVMGVTDVLKVLPKIIFNLLKIEKWILKNNPKAVLTIDYAHFCLILMKRLRKKGYKGKIIHTICPSVWAHSKGRIPILEECLDRLFSILPFEKEIFNPEKLTVSYIGHPLVEKINQQKRSLENLIGIFPGSRKSEVIQNLPKMLKACSIFLKKYPGYEFILSIASEKLTPLITKILKKYPDLPICLINRIDNDQTFHKLTSAICVSGTMAFELALHDVPTVVVYHLTYLNYLIARFVMKLRLPYYSLVNIITNKSVFPELMHKDFSPANVAFSLEKILFNNSQEIQQGCDEMKDLLKTPIPPTEKVALELLEEIH